MNAAVPGLGRQVGRVTQAKPSLTWEGVGLHLGGVRRVLHRIGFKQVFQ